MKNKILLLIFPILINCQNSDNKKNTDNKANTQFLNDISSHSKIVITDITEAKRQPSDEIILATKYPMSKEKKSEYDKNGTLTNDDNDISDVTVYTIKNYDLINEKNEKVEIKPSNAFNGLQEFALSEYNETLYQNLGIKLKLNRKFETLKGFINIEFEVAKTNKKEVKIPVNISINDTIPE